MKVVSHVVFDDLEVVDIIGAVMPFRGAVGVNKNGRDRVTAIAGRVIQGEALDEEGLRELAGVVDDLLTQFGPEQEESFWREVGAPGSDDAIAGLAATRRGQVEALAVVSEVVQDALRRVA